MTDKEIKDFVITTIRGGEKERIIKVVARYFRYLKERDLKDKKPPENYDAYQEAKKLLTDEYIPYNPDSGGTAVPGGAAGK